MMSGFKAFILHLRIPFQLLLAPFFLLGSLFALTTTGFLPFEPSAIGVSWLGVFLLVHVGIYGGATVFNSYYDRDEGPIGCLKHPPPVKRGMLWGSIFLQLVSLGGVSVLSPRAGLVGLAMVVMGICYSHPRWRWKASLRGGLACVALGQGALAVLVGYFAVGHVGVERQVWELAAAASLLVLGLYPLTQIYQIREDSLRGDVTMPVCCGWRFTMGFCAATSLLGIAALLFVMRSLLPVQWQWLFAGAAGVLLIFMARWARRFEEQSEEANHDAAIGFSLLVSLPVSGFIVSRLWRLWF